MRCPDCGGRLYTESEHSKKLMLICERSQTGDCHYAVLIHEIPVLENELQALIDTAPQFLLSRNMSRKGSP